MSKTKPAGLLVSLLLFATTVSAQTGSVTQQVEQNYGTSQGTYESSYMGGGMYLDLYFAVTSLNMKSVNDSLAAFRDAVMIPNDYTDSDRFTKIGAGIVLGATLDYELFPGLKIGPYVGLVYAAPGEVHGTTDPAVYAYDYIWTTTYSAMMVPVAASITYAPPLPMSSVSITLGAHFGVGFASTNWNSEYDTDDPGFNIDPYVYDIPASGSAPYMNFFVDLDLPMSELSSFFIRAGYRLASVKELTVDTSVNDIFPFNDIHSGDTVKDVQDEIVKADFSGVEVGIGFSFGF